jgi:hypothetical protein
VIIRRSLGIWALGLLSAASACSSDDGGGETPASAEALGEVGLTLQTSDGAMIDSFDYTITGPGGFSRHASVDLRGSSTLSTLVGGLPIGSGYSVSLSAAARDGSFTCAGSASFSVLGRAATAVTVKLQCRQQGKTGSVLVNGQLNQCPSIDGISASPQSVLVGKQLSLSAEAHDTDAAPGTLSYAWSASSGTLSSASATAPSFTCTAVGDVVVTLKVSDGDCDDTLTATVGCTTASGGGGVARVVINEVESNGGVPGDWVELYNAGTATADISGWKFKDNDDSHAFYIVPAGTTLAPGAYYMLEEAQFGFGLGAQESARLWDAAGNPVDSYSWTAHAASTYGRCPNGSGPFVATPTTKAAANDCGSSSGGTGGGGAGGGSAGGGSAGGGTGGSGGSGGASGGSGGSAGAAGSGGAAGSAGAGGGMSTLAWPGSSDVVTVDEASFFGTNMSGLFYEAASSTAPAVLWAVQNSPSKLYRLVFNGTSWVPEAGAWASGKLMHYANGTGAPDSEGISKAELAGSAMYVATERDNNNNQVSRLTILRVDTSAASAELTATNEWNITADLPAVGPNLGLEAITFVPDAALLAGGFIDEATHAPYDPATYPSHGGGLFFVGVEGTGNVYGYALNHDNGSFVRVASFSSGQSGIMDLAYDRDSGLLWGYCDNTCGNKSTLFQLSAGAFQINRVYGPPAGLPASNNEGITFAPISECNAGQRAFFWSDDDQINSHAIRRGSISCP